MSAFIRVKYFFVNSKVRLLLFFSFILMFLLQLFYGFQYLDDYLVVLIFILFLNDQTMKYKHPEKIISEVNDQRMRKVMTVLFLILFTIPILLDHYNVSQEIQLFLYKMGFILWAQVFLVDAFFHYKETHSKKWLIFANTAVAITIIGAIAI